MAQRPPTHFLNAKEVLIAPLPNLKIGAGGVQTTTRAGQVKLSYVGNIAFWDTFEEEVVDFMNHPTTQQHLARCQHLPICPANSILSINPEAMATEHIKVGAEITLSARYLERAIAPTVSSVKTMTLASGTSTILPRAVEVGDSWILDRHRRPSGVQPDIVVKVGNLSDVCLIGELKFVVTVDLNDMVNKAIQGRSQSSHHELCKILGELNTNILLSGMMLSFRRAGVRLHAVISYTICIHQQL